MPEEINLENLTNITFPVICNNYKALAMLLREAEKGGDSKKAQVARWNRYLVIRKDGHKFIIEAIKEVPDEATDGRSSGNNTKYLDKTPELLLSYMAEQLDVNPDLSQIKLDYRSIYPYLGFCNQDFYGKYKEEPDFLDKNFNSDQFEHLRQEIKNEMKGHLIKAIENLVKKQLVKGFSKTYYIFDKQENSERAAIKEEIDKIELIEKTVLTELGYSSTSELKKPNSRKEHKDNSKKLFEKKYKNCSYYQKIVIELEDAAIVDRSIWVLTDEAALELRKQVNSLFCEKIVSSSEKSFKNKNGSRPACQNAELKEQRKVENKPYICFCPACIPEIFIHPRNYLEIMRAIVNQYIDGTVDYEIELESIKADQLELEQAVHEVAKLELPVDGDEYFYNQNLLAHLQRVGAVSHRPSSC